MVAEGAAAFAENEAVVALAGFVPSLREVGAPTTVRDGRRVAAASDPEEITTHDQGESNDRRSQFESVAYHVFASYVCQ